MTVSQDQFLQLPHMTWRGEIYAVTERSVRFAHEGADHQVIYRNGVAVEMTGAGAWVYSYTLAFREGITKGPYGALFSRGLNRFLKDFHDNKEPGILFDPIHGAKTCVPQTWDETTDPDRRDGVDIRVEFKEHTPVEGAVDAAASTLDSLETDAGRLDEEVQRMVWPVQQDAPRATANPLAVASGVIQQGNYAVSRTKASVHEVAMRANEVEESAAEAEKNGAPGAGYVRQDARRVRLRALKVAEAPPRDTARAIAQVTYDSWKDPFVIARESGMTIQEFLFWNPVLARSTRIRPGTPIWMRRKTA